MSDWRDFQCFCGPISFSGKNPNPPLNKKTTTFNSIFFSTRGHHTTSNLHQPIESFLLTRHFRLNLLFFQNLSISDRVTFRTPDQLERHNYDNDVKKGYVITVNDVTLPPSSCPYVFPRRTVHRWSDVFPIFARHESRDIWRLILTKIYKTWLKH